jgi:hypothetical protein
MEAAAGTAATAGSSRVTGRRPALPTGRAVVGGLLVATAAVGTFAAWSGAEQPPPDRLVVAARDLPIGTVLEPEDLGIAALDAPAALEGRAFAGPELVIGQRTVAPLAAGELVQRSSVVVPESTLPGRQVAFAVERASALGGTLQIGEVVDLLATFGSAAADSSTEVVAAGAVVAGLPEVDPTGGQQVVLVTLPPGADALAVVHAVRHGALTVVRSIGEPLDEGARFDPSRTRSATAQEPGS